MICHQLLKPQSVPTSYKQQIPLYNDNTVETTTITYIYIYNIIYIYIYTCTYTYIYIYLIITPHKKNAKIKL